MNSTVPALTVADLRAIRHAASAEPRALAASQRRRRRLLEQLLVAPLHRALALAEAHHAAATVGEDLRLDVARPLDRALEVDPVVAERRPAPRRASAPTPRRARPRSRIDAHALAAAAGRRLEHERIADRARRARAPPRRSPPARASPGTSGDARGAAPASRAASLSPSAAIVSGRGPMNTSPASSHARANAAFSAKKP